MGLLQLMEINKPDRGVFKGMGKLEESHPCNRKYFPRIRNIHQFQYTHHHPNSYATSFQRFFTPQRPVAPPSRPNRNPNQSSFQLGTDTPQLASLTQTDYAHFGKVAPPKPIRQKEEGVVLGNQGKDQQFVTTVMEKFGHLDEGKGAKVSFKNRGASRFNPITGQKQGLTFGFEDFEMGRNNSYKANNLSAVPLRHQKIDIISGRKLTFQ